jgi:hypothetical protein
MFSNGTSANVIASTAGTVVDQSMCQKIPAEYIRALRKLNQQKQEQESLSFKSICQKLFGI